MPITGLKLKEFKYFLNLILLLDVTLLLLVVSFLLLHLLLQLLLMLASQLLIPLRPRVWYCPPCQMESRQGIRIVCFKDNLHPRRNSFSTLVPVTLGS